VADANRCAALQVAHNPTGVDPTQEQWKKLADITESKKAVPVFDTAYQVRSHATARSRAFPGPPRGEQ